MIGVLVVAGLLTSAGFICAHLLDRSDQKRSALHEKARADRLRRSVHRADREVCEQHRQARRAMNDAAGQSWRNRFE